MRKRSGPRVSLTAGVGAVDHTPRARHIHVRTLFGARVTQR